MTCFAACAAMRPRSTFGFRSLTICSTSAAGSTRRASSIEISRSESRTCSTTFLTAYTSHVPRARSNSDTSSSRVWKCFFDAATTASWTAEMIVSTSMPFSRPICSIAWKRSVAMVSSTLRLFSRVSAAGSSRAGLLLVRSGPVELETGSRDELATDLERRPVDVDLQHIVPQLDETSDDVLPPGNRPARDDLDGSSNRPGEIGVRLQAARQARRGDLERVRVRAGVLDLDHGADHLAGATAVVQADSLRFVDEHPQDPPRRFPVELDTDQLDSVIEKGRGREGPHSLFDGRRRCVMHTLPRQ